LPLRRVPYSPNQNTPKKNAALTAASHGRSGTSRNPDLGSSSQSAKYYRECEGIIATACAAACSIHVTTDMWMQRERPSIPHYGRDSSARINGHSRYGIFEPRTELELGTELVLNEDLKKTNGRTRL
jgi:hypothetical protein